MRFELVNVPFEHCEIELPIRSAASRLGDCVERVDEAERRAEPTVTGPLGGAVEQFFAPLAIPRQLLKAFDQLSP
jgi:hypothetical protein